CKRFQTLPGGGGGLTRRQKKKNPMFGNAYPPPHKKKPTKNAWLFKIVAILYLKTAPKTNTLSLIKKKHPTTQ
ncbi:hypothetical protein, partial [Enterobacter intestinihominis]